MPRGPPETETTPGAQTNAAQCHILPPTKPGIMGVVEMISPDPGQAFRLLVPPQVFIAKSHQKRIIGNFDVGIIDMSEFNAHLQYLSDHPPEYGLVTNFPPESLDSACFLWSGVRESLWGLGQEHLGDHKKESNYRIEEVGPQGKGVVAARNFGAGDLILLERPAILQPIFIQEFSEAEMKMLLNKMLARLSGDVRNGFLTLSNNHPESRLFGILRTNSIQFSLPGKDVIKYLAVAIDFSRCNHRCAPLS